MRDMSTVDILGGDGVKATELFRACGADRWASARVRDRASRRRAERRGGAVIDRDFVCAAGPGDRRRACGCRGSVRHRWTHAARLRIDSGRPRSTRYRVPTSSPCVAGGGPPPRRDVCAGDAMIRTRVGAAVLRAYPADTRAALGAEMLSTLLEASTGSRDRFAREAVDLLRLGLR